MNVSSALTQSTAVVVLFKEIVTLDTSAIMVLKKLVMQPKSALLDTTVLMLLLFLLDVLKVCITVSKEPLIFLGVYLVLLVITVFLTTVLCASALRVTSVLRNLPSLFPVS
jgi:hypothetical protein